jgi:hypothetical protein
MFKDCEIIREYLVRSGFMDNYFIWSKHSETQQRIEIIVDKRAKENMDISDEVYSRHNAGCENDCDILAQGFNRIDRTLIPPRYIFFSRSPIVMNSGVKRPCTEQF